MCGIVGHYTYEIGAAPLDEFPALVNCLSHRGPDDATFWGDGRFAFGHRRLSIIDLSSGRQPMATEDGALVVTFNGEIYNYIELREELIAAGHRFQTSSDTEVLLHGYRMWGVDLPARLTGMFAFAIADRERQELFLARDRFGEKPLLYAETARGVSFASELRPLTIAYRERRELDLDALGSYLCLNYVAGDATLMRGVRRLPAATWRRYAPDERVTTGTYWRPAADVDTRPRSMDDAVEELRALLDRSVRFTLRSDVPVGLFLSAGIDSTLVAHSAARSGHLARAFCVGFEEQSYSELPRARATAARLGIPLTPVTLTTDVLSDFFEIVRHADDPLADSSAAAVWTIAREAARHVKVVLAGDGGDELFGGYLTNQASLWHSAAVTPLPLAARAMIAAIGERLPTGESKVSASYKLMRFFRAAPLATGEAHFSWNGTWLPADAARFVADPRAADAARRALASMADRHGLAAGITLGALQRADIGDYLANDILVKSDRMAMAHGLEVRAPFLEPQIAEFALRLPSAFKARLVGQGKRILRRLAARIAGDDVARSKKQGFSIPVHGWLRGPARPLAEELLSPASVAAVPPLRPDVVGRALQDHLAGRRSLGFELWGLMVLVVWHRQHLQNVPALPDLPRPERLAMGSDTVPVAC
jgi:asparagine synthase (glutamine-hydrolysing)